MIQKVIECGVTPEYGARWAAMAREHNILVQSHHVLINSPDINDANWVRHPLKYKVGGFLERFQGAEA